MLTWLTTKRSTLDVQTLDSWLPREFQDLLANLGVPGFRQALPKMVAELHRARRYQHALTVALFGSDEPAKAGAAAAEAHRISEATALHAFASDGGAHGLYPAILASVLREDTRETDIVAYTAALGRCLVAMPETDASQAQLAVTRLRELGLRRLKIPVHVSLAAFPRDGCTLDELIRVAKEEPPWADDASLAVGAQPHRCE